MTRYTNGIDTSGLTRSELDIDWAGEKIDDGFDGGAGTDVVEYFTYGGCWNLALHIHYFTGWKLVQVGIDEGWPEHVAVLSPARTYIDIEGARRRSRFTAKWGNHIEPASLDELENGEWDTGVHGSSAAAFRYAVFVLETLGVHPSLVGAS